MVLVEGNLERPRVAATLGLRLPESAGFSTQVRRHMNGRSRPWGVVRLGPSLTVLAESGAAAAYSAALHSTHFEAALLALRRAYDYVIIDGPAVLGSGDANVLEGVSDGVLLVARAASTKGTALCGRRSSSASGASSAWCSMECRTRRRWRRRRGAPRDVAQRQRWMTISVPGFDRRAMIPPQSSGTTGSVQSKTRLASWGRG